MNLRKAIAIGILIRLVLMPFFAHPYDVFAWYSFYLQASNDISSLVMHFPHLWKITLFPFFLAYSFLSELTGLEAFSSEILPSILMPQWNIEFIPGVLFNFVTKIPIFFSDLALAFVMFKVVKHSTGNKDLAEKAAILLYLNPLLIWISAGRGMWDSIPTLFSMVSLYFLSTRKIAFSAIALAISVLYKLYTIIFIIPIILFLFRRSNQKEKNLSVLKFIIIFVSTLLLDAIPYFSLIPTMVTGLVTPTPFFGLAGFGLTYWSISTLVPELSQFLDLIVYSIIIFMFGLTLYKVNRLSFDKPILNLSIGMLGFLLAFFLSFNFVAEHFLIWALPFIIIITIEKKIETGLLWFTSLTALIYAQKNFPYYLLPTYPWFDSVLEYFARLVQPFQNVIVVEGESIIMPSLSGGFIMTLLGILSSVFFLIMYLELFDFHNPNILRHLRRTLLGPVKMLEKKFRKESR